MTQARRVVLALACLASMLLVLPALAQPPKEPPCSGERQPYMAPAPKNLPESLVPYRPLALLNLTTILSPPPAAGPQQLADKLAVMHAQGSASEDRMGRAGENHD